MERHVRGILFSLPNILLRRLRLFYITGVRPNNGSSSISIIAEVLQFKTVKSKLNEIYVGHQTVIPPKSKSPVLFMSTTAGLTVM